MSDHIKEVSETRIQALPQQVVDRIAAGEVVQRPASVVKELIENSLDASATTIDVQCQNGGMNLLVITDDGCGIHPDDLSLAATRFATSKLKKIDDLKSIMTFGFRGEALASASMVGKLSIISRRRSMNAKQSYAYKMSYNDGTPEGKPQVSAGREGTVVRLEDLFYNLPSRKRAFQGARKESEEYQRILSVVQRYAVQYAQKGVGFVCRKKGGSTDLNTSSLASIKKLKALRNSVLDEGDQDSIKANISEQCTKDVIGHIFGTELQRELLAVNCQEGDVREVSLAALKAMNESGDNDDAPHPKILNATKTSTDGNSLIESVLLGRDFAAKIAKETERDSKIQLQFSFAYKASGFISNGSYCVPKSSSAFLLFINGRLVESAPLRRAIEGVYVDILPKSAKPFVFLSLELPGPHLDVNIHPTKREVAFLHEERLCVALESTVRNMLRSTTTSRTFYTQSLLPEKFDQQTLQKDISRLDETMEQKKKDETKKEDTDIETDCLESDSSLIVESKTKQKTILEDNSDSSKKRKVYDPKNLVRTSSCTQQGAIEPFLVHTNSSDFNTTGSSVGNHAEDSSVTLTHTSDCIFASNTQQIDMTVPGAFTAICRCQIENNVSLPKISPAQAPIVRPKKIDPTNCSYNSIQQLRDDIPERAHADITARLRDSVFVGCVNKDRSLLQSGIELLMINHYVLAKELFYQLALLRFGGMPIAKFADGVDVHKLIEHALMLKDSVASSVSLTQMNDDPIGNTALASQQTEFLRGKAPMLLEYFSIQLDERQVSDSMGETSTTLLLTGLPIILEGHSPSPHALPIFIHRLATEVDWTSEKPCFEGIFTELAAFYAQIPPPEISSKNEQTSCAVDENQRKYVQHTLFPALRYLLVVPKDFATDGSFCKLALLSKLYKIFERC
jgi:DNA mismatch repair protein MLH1